jgi:hypothetical protein
VQQQVDRVEEGTARMGQRPPDTMFASGSVRVHVIRGVLGLVAFVAAFALVGAVGPASLLLILVAGLAWRGCPTCWAVGLTRTRQIRDSGAACASCPPAATQKVRNPV